MQGEFTDAIKQDFSTAPTSGGHWTPIEIIHPIDPQKNLRLINNFSDVDFTVDGQVRTFTAANYDVGKLGSGQDGLQELPLAVGNVNRVAGDWVDEAATHNEPVEVIVHYYLQSDTTTPQLNPPITLFLTDIDVNVFQVSGRLSFVNLKSKQFLSELYTRSRFPSLGNR